MSATPMMKKGYYDSLPDETNENNKDEHNMDTNEMVKMPNPTIISPMTESTTTHKQADEHDMQEDMSRTNQLRNK